MKFLQVRGATSILVYGGLRFLIDPFFAPKGSLPAVPSPHNALRNPLVGLPLPVEELIDVDAVIITHMHHFDHFDGYAAKALPKQLAVFAQDAKEAGELRSLGFARSVPLTEEGTLFNGVTLYRTGALHGAGDRARICYAKAGLVPDACGFALEHAQEKRFYDAGDTVMFEGVTKAIRRHKPEVIALNAAFAQFYDGTPILMSPDEILETTALAPEAVFIATHMDAVNHARLDRKGLRALVAKHHLESRFLIPEDGESVEI